MMFRITPSLPEHPRESFDIATKLRRSRRQTVDPIVGARFLVTGGAGTIGSTIVDQLLDAGAAEVRVLDNFVRGRTENLTGAMESGRVEVLEGDIRDQHAVRTATAGCDVVFHQAAIRITQCA